MKLIKPPTPYEFENQMKDIRDKHNKDLDECHMEMDDYILEVLTSLGYKDGIKVFRSTPKLYS